jgi:hypothetical protein
MSSILGSGARAALPIALVWAFLVPGAALHSGEPPLQLSFSTAFGGVNAEGSSFWEGWLEPPGDGRLRLALQQVESPEAAAKPVWHVRTRWDVEPASGDRAFVAEMEGMVDWKAGAAHLSGVITSGWMKGAWIQAEMHFVQGDARGTLRVVQSLAKRRGQNG